MLLLQLKELDAQFAMFCLQLTMLICQTSTLNKYSVCSKIFKELFQGLLHASDIAY